MPRINPNRRRRATRPRWPAALLLGAGGLLAVAPDARAMWDDQLQLFVGAGMTKDSNVFRISDSQDPRATIGSAQTGDVLTTTTLGLNLDMPFSRQRLQAAGSWNDVRYRRFADLNYVGRDARAAWLWELGDCLSGQLGYSETRTLASFSNIQGRTANSLQTERTYGRLACQLTLNWQVDAGAAKTEQSNSNPGRAENDVQIRTFDAVLRHTTRAGNRFGIAGSQDTGTYPNPQLVAGNAIDNGYVQRSAGVLADWAITVKSTLSARVDRLRRHYDQLPRRNFDGNTYQLSYDWQATGKLNLTAIAQREISPAEDIQTSFVLVEGAELRASANLSEKARLSASGGSGTRDYLGDPGLALGTADPRVDRVRFVGAELTLAPVRALTFRFSGRRETRTSNQPLNDYTVNVVSASARLAF